MIATSIEITVPNAHCHGEAARSGCSTLTCAARLSITNPATARVDADVTQLQPVPRSIE
jgi:hypothetical protein